jgi:hypothetical protein
MLAFEVVDFSDPYHVILGRPCYVKFTTIPSYAYLKLKTPRPIRVITVEARAQQALDYEHSSIDLAAAAVTMAELKELHLWLPMMPLSLEMSPMFRAFKVDEDAKDVQIEAGSLAKTVQIGTSLDRK